MLSKNSRVFQRLRRPMTSTPRVMFHALEARLMLSFTTSLIADVNPTGFSFASGLTVVGDVAFFNANDGTHGAELWITDGTTEGTTLVKDIRTTPSVSSSGSPNNLTPFNGQLYFDANDGVHGFEMWKSDGTADGTSLFVDLNPNAGSGFTALNASLVIGQTLFFTGNDGTHGVELFKTDGTAQGTQLIKDILSGSLGSEPSSLTDVNGTLFFIADDSNSDFNRELWKSDGTTGNTVKIKEINSNGSAIDQYAAMAALNGVIYFSADDGVHGFEPWRSDGTADGTFMIQDVNPGAGSSLFSGNESFYQYFVPYNGNMYFQADDGTHGRELWKTNGTQGNASLLVDLNTAGDAFPLAFTHHNIVANNLLFFSAVGDGVGAELFVTDGTTQGTQLVEDLEPGTSAVAGPGFFSLVPQQSGPPLLFMNALTSATGYEPFVLDTGVQPYDIELVDDVIAGNSSSNPVAFTLLPPATSFPSGGNLFFLGDIGNGDTGLYKTTQAAAPFKIAIQGIKIDDTDGNGERSAGENTPVQGVTVYIDLNGNAQLDAGSEPSTVTDEFGQFHFQDRNIGDTDLLREVLPAGSIQTHSFASVSSDPHIALAQFLNFKLASVHGRITDSNSLLVIGARVYYDANSNGQYDEGEPSGITDSLGNYFIDGLPPGTVTIDVVPKTGYSNATAVTYSTTSGQDKTTNFTLQSDGSVVIYSGFKYNDRNGDGSIGNQSTGIDPRVQGVTIYIDLNDNGVLDEGEPSTVTNENGFFEFRDQSPDYTGLVREVLPAGTIQTNSRHSEEPVGGVYEHTFLNFKTVTASGKIDVYEPASGSNTGGSPPIVTVFNDVNENGVLDDGEVFTFSDADGHYSLSGIGPGTIKLTIVAPTGFTQLFGTLTSTAESGVDISADLSVRQYIFTFDSHTPFHGTMPGRKLDITIRGPGQGTLIYDSIEVQSVVITGTTPQSQVIITSDQKFPVTIPQVTIVDPVGGIEASTVKINHLDAGGITSFGHFGEVKDDHLFTIGSMGATSATAITLTFTDVANTDISCDVPLKSLSVVRWLDTDEDPDTIIAPWIASVTTKGDLKNGIVGDFEAGFILSGVGVATGKPTLNSLNIKGSLAGTSTITGSVGAIKVTGNFTGDITARAIKSFSVGGNAADAGITLTQGVDPKLRALDSLTVKGDVLRTTLRSAGNVSKLTLGSLVDSTIFAGVNDSVVTLPVTLGDFSAPTAAILSLSIKGNPAAPTADAFVNSLVAAGVLGKVALTRVDTTNDEPFGFAADKIGAITGLDQPISKLDTPQEVTDDDLLIRVL